MLFNDGSYQDCREIYGLKKSFPDGQRINGRKVKVSFKDGEVLIGSTMGYDPKREGFFLFPPDPPEQQYEGLCSLNCHKEG
jgi:hypothetical protein